MDYYYDNNYDENFTPEQKKPDKKTKKKKSKGFFKGIAVGAAAMLAIVGIGAGSIAVYNALNPSPQQPAQIASASKNEEKSSQESTQPSDSQNQESAQPSKTPSTVQKTTGEKLSIPEIAEKLTPSTVGVVAKAQVNQMLPGYGYGYGNSETNSSEPTTVSTGSGIIMSEDGYIITNAHVVENGTSYTVVLSDQSEVEATLVGMDSSKDIAVLKIDKTGLTAAEFGNSDELVVGETTVAIGNPMGLEYSGTVTSGLVSALNRELTVDGVDYKVIQTNAAINSGNSGGPLINEYGQVIGVNTLKLSNTEGMGFAIPINTALEAANSIIENAPAKAQAEKLLVGFKGQVLDKTTREYYNLPQGILVVNVEQGSGAAKAGLTQGDIIIKADGQEITSQDDIDIAKGKHKAGETINLTVYRQGEEVDIQVVLSENNTQEQG